MNFKSIILFVFSIAIGGAIVFAYKLTQKSPGKPANTIIQQVVKPNYSIEEPPTESIKGIITTMSGDVKWQSRIATEAATIQSPIKIQQGESLYTGEGKVEVSFLNEANLKMDKQSAIDFIQILPTDFVINMASGSAKFTSEKFLSIRATHLLIKQNRGVVDINFDTDNSLISLNVEKGSVTVAYNDLNLVSHVAQVAENQKLTFNDLTRNLQVE